MGKKNKNKPKTNFKPLKEHEREQEEQQQKAQEEQEIREQEEQERAREEQERRARDGATANEEESTGTHGPSTGNNHEGQPATVQNDSDGKHET